MATSMLSTDPLQIHSCELPKGIQFADMSASEKLQVEDDGLVCPEVGTWAKEKYRLVSMYQELFSMGMKKWDERVYIDLYAAAGYSKVKGSGIVLKGSAVSALTVRHPFDKYIFCEQDPELMGALRERSQRVAPDARIDYICGDCDEQVEALCSVIPQASSKHKVLTLCFVDPFDFGLKFKTIKRLSAFYIDFLVLLAVGMDANRNYELYVTGNSTKIDEALGNTQWRKRWEKIPRRTEFRSFLAQEFSSTMESLGYLPQREMKLVRNTEKNAPMYYLALFSRSETAYSFWRKVLKDGTDQKSFGF
jgi:three-Cys-motif partner protein